jgi:hypothetical protein
MKALLTICLILLTSFAHAQSPHAASVKGEVLEVLNVDSYTYLRLKTQEGEKWAAVSKVAVAKGSQVAIENATVMNNFTSKTLKRTFATIIFGSLAAPAQPMEKISVPKAVGANAKTVAEIVTNSAALKDKPVLLRGKIVKYNPGIMGRNWLHLQDGSGNDTNNDILVTTHDEARLGDVVTIKGIVHNNKDFGAGYSYKVLIEEAVISK